MLQAGSFYGLLVLVTLWCIDLDLVPGIGAMRIR
jgi:hypothetical protein